jgi:hypothetical protein
MKTNAREREYPEKKPHSYSHCIYDKNILTKVPKAYDGEKTTFSTNIGENWIFIFVEDNLELCVSPCTNINSKWIKNCNTRLKITNAKNRNKH